jgi:hypothetical protein
MNEPEPEQRPLTPDYDARAVPMVEHPPAPETAAEAAPAPAAPAPPQRKAKPVPRHKRKLGKRRQQKPKPSTGPLTEVEALNERIRELQYRKDLKLLDAQLRVITLRKFLQSHDLWTPFLALNKWW